MRARPRFSTDAVRGLPRRSGIFEIFQYRNGGRGNVRPDPTRNQPNGVSDMPKPDAPPKPPRPPRTGVRSAGPPVSRRTPHTSASGACGIFKKFSSVGAPARPGIDAGLLYFEQRRTRPNVFEGAVSLQRRIILFSQNQIMKKIIIIGGGLSGTLSAIQLARLKAGYGVTIIEKNPESLGRGIAYHADFTHQPLNVAAGGMSLFSDKPSDFVEWLEVNHFKYNHLIETISSQAFAPRKIFGDYVLEHLERLQQDPASKLQIRIDEALSVMDLGAHKGVVLASGHVLQADQVILALGNFPPADIFPKDSPVRRDPRYSPTPWTDKVYSQLNGDENILLVGSGLSAVDIVLGLSLRKFKGKVTMLSRNGRLPCQHEIPAQAFPITEFDVKHPKKMLRWVRNLIRANPDYSWVSILDGLRPYSQKIWKAWTVDEKKYFLTKVRPYWEIARHRIPKTSSSVLNEMMFNDALELIKGRIVDAEAVETGIRISYRSEHSESSRLFQKIVNCTGPESNYRRINFPIVKDLINRGKVAIDELGLGIQCTPDGRIINHQGDIEEGIWCVGPMRKAVLWETTALREIRGQTAELAATIAGLGV